MGSRASLAQPSVVRPGRFPFAQLELQRNVDVVGRRALHAGTHARLGPARTGQPAHARPRPHLGPCPAAVRTPRATDLRTALFPCRRPVRAVRRTRQRCAARQYRDPGLQPGVLHARLPARTGGTPAGCGLRDPRRRRRLPRRDRRVDASGRGLALPPPLHQRRLHRGLQRRRGAGEGRSSGIPQQRHRAATGVARCAARHVRVAPERRAGRRAADLSGWAPAGSRRRGVRRRLGLELRPLRFTRRSPLCQPARCGLLLRRGDRDSRTAVP